MDLFYVFLMLLVFTRAFDEAAERPLWAYSVEKREVFTAPHQRINGCRRCFTRRLWPGLGLAPVWPVF